jgi:hypothetical protein
MNLKKMVEDNPINPQSPNLKNHRIRNIMICMAVVVLIVVMVTALLYNGNGAQKTTITGVNCQIEYPINTELYFGAVSQSIPITNQPNQVLEVTSGQQFYISFSPTESALASESHQIYLIRTTTPGFSIVSVDPQLPIEFTAGSSTRITITLQSPNTPFTGALNIVVATY